MTLLSTLVFFLQMDLARADAEESEVEETTVAAPAAEVEEVVVVGPTLTIEGGCFSNWGTYGEHFNASYLRNHLSSFIRIQRFDSDMREHLEKFSNLIETFPAEQKNYVISSLAQIMKSFEYDEDLIKEYKAASTAAKRSDLLTAFFVSLYPQPLAIKYKSKDLKRFANYRKIAEKHDEVLRDYVSEIADVVGQNNYKKAPCKDPGFHSFLSMYVRNAGTEFPCTNCGPDK